MLFSKVVTPKYGEYTYKLCGNPESWYNIDNDGKPRKVNEKISSMSEGSEVIPVRKYNDGSGDIQIGVLTKGGCINELGAINCTFLEKVDQDWEIAHKLVEVGKAYFLVGDKKDWETTPYNASRNKWFQPNAVVFVQRKLHGKERVEVVTVNKYGYLHYLFINPKNLKPIEIATGDK